MSDFPETLPERRADGLFFLADPHVAGTPPGQRLEGYAEQVLDKLRAGLDYALEHNLEPVILGDLFHWPRENPNQILVELMRLFGPRRPWVLVGNHDKYQARLTEDCSIAVLRQAGAVRLMDAEGPWFRLLAGGKRVLVGASPDGFPLPRAVERGPDDDEVIWLAHHNLSFPEFPEKQVKLREIPGVDWVINGHIHRPQPTLAAGATRYANPGNITRLTFTRRTRERVPAGAVWRPGAEDIQRVELPHLPFEDVFPDQELPPETEEESGRTRADFLDGLERLAWRRTAEGAGLRDFLTDYLDPEEPETGLIWELYTEVTRHD
ncbi:metallophosphoesterase [Desulfohalovibrio reitneri]|uniref:metallophosphoesterase n=1 Tax=Desulfohalovibrio reitneri TaxID=1307759 RepID=UPI0004A73843|nr:metallophosphoesterase [Desulfohalovibrio reitneri]